MLSTWKEANGKTERTKLEHNCKILDKGTTLNPEEQT
jgi:hypothetical protein